MCPSPAAAPTEPAALPVTVGVLAALAVLTLGTAAEFARLRLRPESHLKGRAVALRFVMMALVPALATVVMGPLGDALAGTPPLALSCVAVLVCRFLVFPLTFPAIVLRVFTLRLKQRQQEKLLKMKLFNVKRLDRGVVDDEERNFQSGPFARRGWSLFGSGNSPAAAGTTHTLVGTTNATLPATAGGGGSGTDTPTSTSKPGSDNDLPVQVKVSSFQGSTATGTSGWETKEDETLTTESELSALRRSDQFEMVNRITVGVFLAMYALPMVCMAGLVAVHVRDFGASCTGCSLTPRENLVLAVLYGLYGSGCLVFAALGIKADSVHVKREILVGTLGMFLLTTLGSSLATAQAYGVVPPVTFGYEWITIAGLLLPHGAFVTWRVLVLDGARAWRLLRPRRTQADEDALHGTVNDLRARLADSAVNVAFSLHLEREYASENIKFYNEVQLWKQAYESVSVHDRYKWAMKIFLTFVPLSAPMQINISDTLRQSMATAFALSGEVKVRDFSRDAFLECEGEILSMLRGSYLLFEQRHPEFALVKAPKKSVSVAPPRPRNGQDQVV